jgi:hypothetical protein
LPHRCVDAAVLAHRRACADVVIFKTLTTAPAAVGNLSVMRADAESHAEYLRGAILRSPAAGGPTPKVGECPSSRGGATPHD